MGRVFWEGERAMPWGTAMGWQNHLMWKRMQRTNTSDPPHCLLPVDHVRCATQTGSLPLPRTVMPGGDGIALIRSTCHRPRTWHRMWQRTQRTTGYSFMMRFRCCRATVEQVTPTISGATFSGSTVSAPSSACSIHAQVYTYYWRLESVEHEKELRTFLVRTTIPGFRLQASTYYARPDCQPLGETHMATWWE